MVSEKKEKNKKSLKEREEEYTKNNKALYTSGTSATRRATFYEGQLRRFFSRKTSEVQF